MKKVMGFLSVWGTPVFALALAALGFVQFGMYINVGWAAIGLFGGMGALVWAGVSAYTAVAEVYLRRYKRRESGVLSYKAELRQLKRARRKALRNMFTMNAYSHSRNSSYNEILQYEKKIAKHMGLEVEDPIKKPSARY